MPAKTKKILIDICHPAHVHFFRNPIRILEARGHEVLLTSREKDVTIRLLDQYGLEHLLISTAGKSGIIGLGRELIERNLKLLRIVREHRPDCISAVGGTFAAHTGFISRIPSVIFYDTETATLQNLITYPFSSLVVVPDWYTGWLPRGSRKYPGFQELSYLHPSQFTPDRGIAQNNGLDASRATFLIRTVAWTANHDLGKSGLSLPVLRAIVDRLSRSGKVLISSESRLPEDLEGYSYTGNASEIHHLLAFCRMYIGEGATMATEAALLGTPTIYCARQPLINMKILEKRYGILKQVVKLSEQSIIEHIESMMSQSSKNSELERSRLLKEVIDVAGYAADLIENA